MNGYTLLNIFSQDELVTILCSKHFMNHLFFVSSKVFGSQLIATATYPLKMPSLCLNYFTTKEAVKSDQMQFLTTARGKLKRLATRCLGQTIRAAGQETMLRALMTSMGSPNCAYLTGKAAMVLEKTRMEMCLFTNWPEVDDHLFFFKKKNPSSLFNVHCSHTA